jgi:hypothetical protein
MAGLAARSYRPARGLRDGPFDLAASEHLTSQKKHLTILLFIGRKANVKPYFNG